MKDAHFALAAAILAGVAVAADRVDIVSESQLGTRWAMAPGVVRVVPGYPASLTDKSRDVCINIGFSIGADGKTSNFSQVKAWDSAKPHREPAAEQIDAFLQLSALAVSRWQFAPVGDRPLPVYTSAKFAFDGTGPLGADEILAKCQVDDLKRFVEKTKRDAARKSGDPSKRQLEVNQTDSDAY